MKRNILDKINTERVFFDGATGSVLQSRGLRHGVPPETFNEERPQEVVKLHREYLEAGADIIKTNTFGINPLKYADCTARVKRAIALARRACEGYEDKYIALDVGPLGRLISPLGDLSFSDAYDAFSLVVRAAADEGVDLILIETMSDLYEAKCATLAARENSDLPVFVSCVFDARGKLMTGADPHAVIATLEGLGASAIGLNCSLGPDKMLPILKIFKERSSLPIIANPNAGLPRVENGKTVYDLTADGFAEKMESLAEYATVLGGCCGTDNEYIRKLIEHTENIPFFKQEKKCLTVISSYNHALYFEKTPVLIGERINPTGKPKLKEALRTHNLDYLLSEAVGQTERGAHVLDVNVGVPGIDEPSLLSECVFEIQTVSDLPLQIDTANVSALDAAMRIYNGKPLVNSVNGKKESMDAVFPLVKKYGGAVIALTLDENGIPDTAEKRVEIAEKIIAEAAKYGIGKNDIIVDPLTLSVSAEPKAAKTTVKAIEMLTSRGIKTSLGVSNVSFGLPERDKINSAFFTVCMHAGLCAAIMNPYSERMQDAYLSYKALSSLDDGFEEYLSANTQDDATRAKNESDFSLEYAIMHGIRDALAQKIADLSLCEETLDTINSRIIPALNEVGEKFERGTAYLPQLLRCAECASYAFDLLKEKIPKGDSLAGKVVLATVKGDVHDIGKNIVKVLLESYGFECIDLGRDVSYEKIVDAVRRTGARLVGLSALMTTTVPAMKIAIERLHEECVGVAVMVGGAVLTQEYADRIGADFYGKDAMESVRIAQKFYERKK